MPKQFFSLIPPEEARRIFMPQISHLTDSEWVSTTDAMGRVLSQAVYSPQTLPEFRRSTVDGYAVRADNTQGAGEESPVILDLLGEVPMGALTDRQVQEGQAMLVHTGGMVPDGADAVVMLEVVEAAQPGDSRIAVGGQVSPGENVIQVGEDIKSGDTLLPARHRLREQDIGGLLAVGLTTVEVVRKPRIAIFATGDEVIDPKTPTRPGQVRDINSNTIAALARKAGAEPQRKGILPDHFETILERVQAAYQDGADMIVITAGSSVSVRDVTADVFARLGEPGVLVHGLQTRPGKPTILGIAGRVPLLGLPGNPVSAFVQFSVMGIPVVYALLGASPPRSLSLSLPLAGSIQSPDWREDYIPMRLVTQDGAPAAEPIDFKSNLIFSLVHADGLIRIPIGQVEARPGDQVEVSLF